MFISFDNIYFFFSVASAPNAVFWLKQSTFFNAKRTQVFFVLSKKTRKCYFTVSFSGSECAFVVFFVICLFVCFIQLLYRESIICTNVIVNVSNHHLGFPRGWPGSLGSALLPFIPFTEPGSADPIANTFVVW